jgi:para-aminobenzoate synthetase component 1
MKPLICFYKNNQYLFSENYERYACPESKSVNEFIKRIESDFFSELKIIQVNFENDDQNIFIDKPELYKNSKATVFVLKESKLLTLEEIRTHLNPNTITEDLQFESLTTQNQFIEKTDFILQQIKEGRIYQANLTSPLRSRCQANSTSLFYKYESKFNGPYKALLPLSEVDLISFSPELFLQQQDGILITRPIKGSLHQDEDFTAQLMDNKKENAELSMIVDLLRNDLNAISEKESAFVNEHRAQMQLGYIQHTFSEIAVKSRSPLSHVLQKTFPGGSISGCPKIESLKVIGEVEDYKRQAYTGTLGWWKENDFCLNITIRSFVKTADELFYNAGCGIVYDSEPDAEWNEYLLKTGALNVR